MLRNRQFRRGGRSGFTFIELIVGLAIMVLIASMVTPSLVGVLDEKRRDGARFAFEQIAEAVDSFATDVGEYPGQLTHLTTQITAQPDLCGSNYSGGEQGAWDGPYVTRFISVGGLPVGIGRLRNQLGRFPNTLNPTHMVGTVDSVVIEDALALNQDIDNDGNDASANFVRWTTLSAADGLVTLGLYMPIADLC
jgi:prepilin-type N-terminal cleavage/methylation domain-containing protein